MACAYLQRQSRLVGCCCCFSWWSAPFARSSGTSSQRSPHEQAPSRLLRGPHRKIVLLRLHSMETSVSSLVHPAALYGRLCRSDRSLDAHLAVWYFRGAVRAVYIQTVWRLTRWGLALGCIA